MSNLIIRIEYWTRKVFKEDGDTHAIIKLVADNKEHVVDSFGQQNFSVTANDLKVHVSGGGSWYRTDFNMDRMSGSYILTESERLDKSGYNWSTNKLYGVCMTTESGSWRLDWLKIDEVSN